MEMGMDFKEFQKIMNEIMRDEESREAKKSKCECKCDCSKEKEEQVEDLYCRLIDELMMELGFPKADEQPHPKKANVTSEDKTIRACPLCLGGNLVKGMKLYSAVVEKDAIKFYEVPVAYCPTCGRKLGESK